LPTIQHACVPHRAAPLTARIVATRNVIQRQRLTVIVNWLDVLRRLPRLAALEMSAPAARLQYGLIRHIGHWFSSC